MANSLVHYGDNLMIDGHGFVFKKIIDNFIAIASGYHNCSTNVFCLLKKSKSWATMDSVIIFEIYVWKKICYPYLVARFDEILSHETQNCQVDLSIKFWYVKEFEVEERCWHLNIFVRCLRTF